MKPVKSDAPRQNYRERTKNRLSKALFELLEEKPIRKITISEICEKAMLHRTTFYNYFYDIFDLAGYGLERLTAENEGGEDESLAEKTDRIIYFIQRYRRIFINMYDTEYKDEILELVSGAIENELKKAINVHKAASKRNVSSETFIRFCSGGLEKLIGCWFETELPENELRREILAVLDMIRKELEV